MQNLTGQGNNPKCIKKLFARKISISGYGGIKNVVLKKAWNFHIFRMRREFHFLKNPGN